MHAFIKSNFCQVTLMTCLKVHNRKSMQIHNLSCHMHGCHEMPLFLFAKENIIVIEAVKC